jgi:hypothetical protein
LVDQPDGVLVVKAAGTSRGKRVLKLPACAVKSRRRDKDRMGMPLAVGCRTFKVSK